MLFALMPFACICFVAGIAALGMAAFCAAMYVRN